MTGGEADHKISIRNVIALITGALKESRSSSRPDLDYRFESLDGCSGIIVSTRLECTTQRLIFTTTVRRKLSR